MATRSNPRTRNADTRRAIARATRRVARSRDNAWIAAVTAATTGCRY